MTGPISVESASDRRWQAHPWRQERSRASCRRHRPAGTAHASAEQRWPALSNADVTAIARDLLRQRRRIHDHRVLPAGLRDQRRDRARARRERAVDRSCGLRGAGECHAGKSRIAEQCVADPRPVARKKMEHIRRYAGLMQQARRSGRDERRLLGRFGEHGIAGGQRAGNLARENRKRKIPRTYAGKDAFTVQRELIVFACGSGKPDRPLELLARLRGVEAEKVDCLAQFAQSDWVVSCRLRAPQAPSARARSARTDRPRARELRHVRLRQARPIHLARDAPAQALQRVATRSLPRLRRRCGADRTDRAHACAVPHALAPDDRRGTLRCCERDLHPGITGALTPGRSREIHASSAVRQEVFGRFRYAHVAIRPRRRERDGSAMMSSETGVRCRRAD